MAYDPALPTPKDRVRLLLGDTGSEELLQDAEIEALLVLDPSPQLAAAAGAEAIAAKLAQRVDTALPGGVRLAFSQRVEHYWRLATRLRAEATSEALPVAVRDPDALVADGGAGVFAIGMHDVDAGE